MPRCRYWDRWYWVVSKSLFLFLLLVTLLTAGVSLQSGGLRPGGENFNPQREIQADIASLKTDAHLISKRLGDIPLGFHWIWVDFRYDWQEIQADATLEVQMAARRLSSFIRRDPRPVS